MTTASTSAIAGAAGPHISTGSSGVISPEQFKHACNEIVQRQSGDAAHRALDLLVTELLSSLGYGEGMAVFLAAVTHYHTKEAT